MSGADVCREMAELRSKPTPSCDGLSCVLGNVASGIGKAISGGLAGILGASNDTKSTSITILENSMSDISRQIYNKTCDNDTNYNQENLIDNLKCVEALGCGAPIPDYSSMTPPVAELTARAYQQTKDLCRTLINGDKIIQANTLSSQQNCAIDGAIEILSKEKLDSNLLVVYEKMLESKGLLSSNQNDSASCNNVSNKIDRQTYIDSIQKCYNKLNLNQKNVANCARNVDQSNISNMIQACMLQEKILMDTVKEIETDVTIEDKLTMKASGLSLGIIALIIGLIIFVVVIGFLMKKKK